MTETPAFDALRRGHVVLAPDPFKSDEEITRPWVVVNTERHPFDGDQYVVMGLTTRTWYDDRIPLDNDDFRHKRAPKDSAIIPHAVASLQPALVTDYVCRVKREPLDLAVETLLGYLRTERT